MESFFSHLKNENLYLTNLQSISDLEQAIREYVSFYNHERFQKKLNDRSPVEYRVRSQHNGVFLFVST
ncbi:IS3 family transposase [Paenibacillus elgii]|nr:IS3 family transposase [Paenibacillus elgii]